MRKCVLALTLGISMLFSLTGCAESEMQEVQLGTEFTLGVGQSATLKGEDLTITFVEVITDSRCPSDAICIWLGEASCLAEFTDDSETRRKVLTQPGLSAPVTTGYARYEITFDLLPYPTADKPIKAEDYRLHLTIRAPEALSGGILATFDVVGERYRVFITNDETIEQVLALQRGESQATIPSGRIVRGSVAYNQPWSWHIDPDDIHMAEMTIELCDGLPSHVEGDLDYWVDTVQRFCPWSAELVEIQDFR
jgi:hypothetical protein